MISFGTASSSYSPEAVNVWNPQQQALWNTFSNQLSSDVQSPVPSYPGQLYVPTTSQEQTYFNDVPNLVQSLAGARQAISQPAYTVNPQTTLSEFQQIYAQPESQQFQNVTLPGINQTYAGPGYWGTARANAVQNAVQGLTTTEAGQYGQLEQTDIAAQRQAALQEQNLQGQAMPQLATAEAGMLGSAGQYSRSIAQQQLASDYLRWTSGETVDGVTPAQYNPFMQAIFSALGLNQYVVGTQGSSSSTNLGLVFGSSSGSGTPSTACWVAREVYGANNPKWLEFRSWLLNKAPKWFRYLYLTYGERFAKWLHKHSWLKPFIRKWMDSKIALLYINKTEVSHELMV